MSYATTRALVLQAALTKGIANLRSGLPPAHLGIAQ